MEPIADPTLLVPFRKAADVLGLGVGTLLNWVMARIFHPIHLVRGSVGPGRGSKCDFPDLVAGAVTGSMLNSGLRYSHLQLDSSAAEPALVRIQDLRTEEGLQNPLPEKKVREVQPQFRRIDSLEERQIQEFLEKVNYEAVVMIDFGPCWTMEAEEERFGINIWFAQERYKNWLWRQSSGDRSSIPSERTTFIYCRFWAAMIKARLKILA